MTLPLRITAAIFASVLNWCRNPWPERDGNRLVGRQRVRHTAEAVRAVAVDAAVADVERCAGDRGSLSFRHRDRLRVGNGGQSCADVGDEVRDLRLRDHLAPDRHVGLLRVRGLAETVVDDVRELRHREAVSDRLQRRHGRIDITAALHTVAIDAPELDERVRAGSDLGRYPRARRGRGARSYRLRRDRLRLLAVMAGCVRNCPDGDREPRLLRRSRQAGSGPHAGTSRPPLAHFLLSVGAGNPYLAANFAA